MQSIMSERHYPVITLLASGSGSTAEAVIHATQTGILQAEVVQVISNNEDAGVFDRVDRLNKQYGLGIRKLHISGQTHPTGAGQRGEQSLAESEAICAVAAASNTALVGLVGYMRKVRGELLEEYGALSTHTSSFDARMLNTHPGPLPHTQGYHGIHVQEKVLEDGLSYSAQTTHAVAADYDTGSVFRSHPVPVMPGDTAEDLSQNVQTTEKVWLPIDIQDYLNDQRLSRL
ncbi:MAG: phosphoribosylglycinamide formyltransferase [Candidatus Saccharibacteria bacterium]|nr:phosphoribosylglycinamide formyltransferase [Candidatus Saccharibacteria bacterium]